MQLKPLFNRVMYEITSSGETKTEAGLILSAGTLDEGNPIVGKILDIGPDVKTVKIGQTFLLDRGVSSRYMEGFGDTKSVRYFVEEKHIIAVESAPAVAAPTES